MLSDIRADFRAWRAFIPSRRRSAAWNASHLRRTSAISLDVSSICQAVAGHEITFWADLDGNTANPIPLGFVASPL